MKIVIADKISSSASAIFGEHRDWKVVTTDKETLPRELTDADAILVRSATFVDAAMMDKAPKLRVIGRAGVGVDNVDLDAATKRGIVVMNTPGGNAVAVAEHTFALMLALDSISAIPFVKLRAENKAFQFAVIKTIEKYIRLNTGLCSGVMNPSFAQH